MALEPDDFERLKSKLEETIQGIKQVDGKYTYLPIFMFNEMPLKNYYRGVGSLASQIEENINDVLTAYRDLIQEEKPFLLKVFICYYLEQGQENKRKELDRRKDI